MMSSIFCCLSTVLTRHCYIHEVGQHCVHIHTVCMFVCLCVCVQVCVCAVCTEGLANVVELIHVRSAWPDSLTCQHLCKHTP